MNSSLQQFLHGYFNSQSASLFEGMLDTPAIGAASFSAGSLPAVNLIRSRRIEAGS
jgi:hypothetical protein